MIRAVVFDLDGTLADTADLATGRRRPYDVLKLSPPASTGKRLRFDDERDLIPGFLATKGYRVGVVSNSPLAYASTLLDLLNIDFERLLAGSAGDFKSKSEKLLSLASDWKIRIEDILYVGDTEEDMTESETAGCQFIFANSENFNHLANLGIIDRIDTSVDFDDLIHPVFRKQWTRCNSCTNDQLRNVVGRKHSNGRCLNCGDFFHEDNEYGFWNSAEQSHLEKALLSEENDMYDLFVSQALPAKLAKLEAKPGTHDREILQKEILYNLPPKARSCVINFDLNEGIFQFPLWLITKSEIRQNRSLREAALWAASRLYPEHFDSNNGNSRFIVTYRSNLGHNLYTKLKDFRGRNDYSRPEPHLSLGFFPALVIAGHISLHVYYSDGYYSGPEPHILPMPSKPFDEDFPTEFSIRFAYRISRLTGKEISVIFDHGNGGSELTLLENDLDRLDHIWGEHIFIDDQYTFGKTMKSAEELVGGSPEFSSKFTWSKSINDNESHKQNCENCSIEKTNDGWGLIDECLMPPFLLETLKRNCINTAHIQPLTLFPLGEYRKDDEDPEDVEVDINATLKARLISEILKSRPEILELPRHSFEKEKEFPPDIKRHGLEWTEKEIDLLFDLLPKDTHKDSDLSSTIEVISELLERSVNAIEWKLRL